VAEDAADGLEQGHAPQLGLAEGGGVAADEAVIGAVRGDQGALEGGQGLGDAVEGDLPVAEGPGEVPAVAGVGGEAPFRLAGAVQVHFHGVEDGTLGLLLQGRGAAVPEQHRLEGRVPYRRRVARAALPRFPQGGGAPVAAGLGVEVVAGTAGLGALAREAGFVEETFPQGDLGGVARVVGRLRRLQRQGFPDVGRGRLGHRRQGDRRDGCLIFRRGRAVGGGDEGSHRAAGGLDQYRRHRHFQAEGQQPGTQGAGEQPAPLPGEAGAGGQVLPHHQGQQGEEADDGDQTDRQ